MTQQDSQLATGSATAAVFGGSVSGLMSALVLAKRGFDVVLYEKRDSYTRNIQWGIRQCFIDYLVGVDQDAADDFSARASSIKYGHRFLADKSSLYESGAYHHQQRTSPRAGAYSTRDLSAAHTLSEEIVCLIPAKVLEQLLYDHLRRHRVTVHHRMAPEIAVDSASMRYYATESGVSTQYDLIVVCEGASSTTRAKAGIRSMSVSRPITQVSGEVYLKRGGMITEYLHAIKTPAKLREELLLSLLISTERHQSSWIVGDVSSQCLSALKGARNKGGREKIAEAEFRKIAARTMLDTVENIHEAGYRGAVRSIELFELQAKISNKAVAGRNLVLAGDAVGVGHWAVGGGMHVAAVCHTQRLDKLASSVGNRANVDAALQEYSLGALADTMAWISASIRYYYLSIPSDVMKAVFDKLMSELMANNSIDVPKRLKSRVTEVYFG